MIYYESYICEKIILIHIILLITWNVLIGGVMTKNSIFNLIDKSHLIYLLFFLVS